MHTAENGLQAVQIVASHPQDYFKVILLDINMPIMDGYEACQRIYNNLTIADNKRPQVYALTADTSPETTKMVADYPFDGMFSKLADEVEVKHIRD